MADFTNRALSKAKQVIVHQLWKKISTLEEERCHCLGMNHDGYITIAKEVFLHLDQDILDTYASYTAELDAAVQQETIILAARRLIGV